MGPLANELCIAVNYANPQEHAPKAEQSARVVKVRARVARHRLPFERLPRATIKALVTDTPKKLSFFPSKNGASPRCSPHITLRQ